MDDAERVARMADLSRPTDAFVYGQRVRHYRDTDALGTVLLIADGKVHVHWDKGGVVAQEPHQIAPYVRTTKERVEGLIKHATTPFIAVQVTLLRQIVDDLDLLEEYKVHPLLTQLRREIPNEHTYAPSTEPGFPADYDPRDL